MIFFKKVLIANFILCQYYNDDSLKNWQVVFKKALSLKGKVIHHQHKGYIGALKMCIFLLNSVHVFMLA